MDCSAKEEEEEETIYRTLKKAVRYQSHMQS
jgi:hypothetical protein